MSKKQGHITLAWRSKAARNASWAFMAAVFVLVVVLGSLVREKEKQLREDTLINTARTLASTALSAGGDADDILLKVNDLLNIESVQGVKLIQGADTPLSVGDTSETLLNQNGSESQRVEWSENNHLLDVGLKLDATLPYDWLFIRLNAQSQMDQPIIGTLITWLAAPFLAFITGLVSLWISGRFFMSPIKSIQDYLQENSGSYALESVPHELTKRHDETGLLAKQVEALRVEMNEARTKMEFQSRFLHETPYPLLRCSVNRKVLYSNVAARSHEGLFGDETKEFVSPALSELVRKAFYESKQVYGDIRCGNYIIGFRAIPVLDAGYVNLYGETVRRPEELF